MDYKKLYTRQFALEDKKKTQDELEWSHFDFPKTIMNYYPIEYIDVCDTPPFPIAITAGSKVVVCESDTSPPDQTISRFQKKAYGAKFRGDGRLLAAGSEQHVVKLFDYKKKTLLRTFTGHTRPVHRVDFIYPKTELASFSDDKSIIIWDIASERIKQTFTGHTDIIRAGVTSSTSENIIISGSYDNTIKVWDTRLESNVLTFTHGSNIEALLWFPFGSRFASAGVADLKIWDFVAGKALKKFSFHHKSITSLTYVAKTNTLLSGSLDRHVKIYSMDKMRCSHSLDYPSPILSLGITNTASTLIVGMSSGDSGLLSFQHANKEKKSILVAEERNRHDIYRQTHLMKKNMKYTNEGTSQFIKCEIYLKKFNYTKCLNVLSHKEARHQPANIVAVYQKLVQLNVLKQVLRVAVGNVIPFTISFVIKYTMEPLYTRVLCIIAEILIDLYKESNDKILYGNFITKLQNEYTICISNMNKLVKVKALCEMILAAKSTRRRASTRIKEVDIKEK